MQDIQSVIESQYERDSLVTTQVDRRDLATVARLMVHAGGRPRYASEIVRFAIQMLANQADSLVGKIKTTKEAEMLLAAFIDTKTLNSGGRLKDQLERNLELDDLIEKRSMTNE